MYDQNREGDEVSLWIMYRHTHWISLWYKTDRCGTTKMREDLEQDTLNKGQEL